MKEYKYTINGNEYNVAIKNVEGNMADVEVNGMVYHVQMEKVIKKQMVTVSKPAAVAKVSPENPASTPPAPKTPLAKPAANAVVGAVKSPLPGVILDINIKVGDTVKSGQKLLILEAMKMENVINSDRDGTVTEICVSKGDSVLEGANLVIVG